MIPEHVAVASPGRLAIPPVMRLPRARSWVAVCVLGLIVAAEYQLRRRSQEATVSGVLDLQIATELAVYAIVGAYLVTRLRLTRVGRPHELTVALWAYIGVMLLAAGHSPYPRLALARSGQLVVGALLVLTIARTARRVDLHRLAHAYIGLVVLSVPLGVVLPFAKDINQQGRFNWLYVHPVYAGVFLSIAVVLAAAYLADRQLDAFALLPRWAYGVALGILGGALIATKTRGAVIAAIVALPVVTVLCRRPGRRFDAGLMWVLAGALTILLTAPALTAFLARGQSIEQVETLNSRTQVWEQAWHLVGDHTITGLGLSASRGAFLDEFGLGGAHNALVEVLVDGGVIGVTGWLALVVGVAIAVWRLATTGGGRRPRHPDGALLLGVYIVLLVNAITTSGLGQAADLQSVWLLTLVGWILVAHRERWPAPAPAPAPVDGPR